MKLYGSRLNLEVSCKPDIELGYIDGVRWRIPHDIDYELPEGTVTVPQGYVTNMASIPRWLWSFFGPPTGAGVGAAYGLSAILHDWLYDQHKICGHPIERSRADEAFRTDMLWRWVKPWRAWAMWAAVRLFGGRGWRNRNPDQKIMISLVESFV